jgi:hypothetical protein
MLSLKGIFQSPLFKKGLEFSDFFFFHIIKILSELD